MDLIQGFASNPEARLMKRSRGSRISAASDLVYADREKCNERLTDLWIRSLPSSLDRPAIATSTGRITREVLAGQVAGLVEAMLSVGIGKGQTVCIYLEKSADQIAACLAISIIGAIYVPIDLDQPVAQQMQILSGYRRLVSCMPPLFPTAWRRASSDTRCIDLSQVGTGRIETLLTTEELIRRMSPTSSIPPAPRGSRRAMVTLSAAVTTSSTSTAGLTSARTIAFSALTAALRSFGL